MKSITLASLMTLAAPLTAAALPCEDFAVNAAVEQLLTDRAEGVAPPALSQVLSRGQGSFAVTFASGETYLVDTFIENGQCQLSLRPWQFIPSQSIDLRSRMTRTRVHLERGPGIEILLPSSVPLDTAPQIVHLESWGDAECHLVSRRVWTDSGSRGWALWVNLIAGTDSSACSLVVSTDVEILSPPLVVSISY